VAESDQCSELPAEKDGRPVTYSYAVADGDLVIKKSDTDSIVWRGRPDDSYPVSVVLPLQESDDCLVLLEYSSRSGYGLENLLRCRLDGSIVWRAEQPERAHDRYVGMRWTEEGLSAGSWSGYRVLLDTETGRIRSLEFTK
jgi:hypothetical protein